MKILFVISSLQIGGEQRAASILTNGLIQTGHTVDMLVLNQKVEKQFEFNPSLSVEYADCDQKKTKNIARCKAVLSKAAAGSYDIMIAFATIPSIICSMTSVLHRVPVVVCERNDPAIYPLHFKAFRYIAYRFAAGAVFQTAEAAAFFDFLPALDKTVIPNPLNIMKLPEPFEGERRKRIVNTARLVVAKNQQMLIKAFSVIAQKYPDYDVVIYGDGPEKDKLLNCICENGLDGRITIHEAIPDILDEINQDSVFVLCSDNEGFPNSLAEALALGIPSISTDCRIGGPKDMIHSGENGTLVEVGNIRQLAQAMDELLGSERLRDQYHRGYKAIRKRLNSEVIVKKWINYLEKVLANL